jgi:DNA polymerase
MPARMDVLRAVKLWLQQAADAYGGDLPLRAPGLLALPAPGSIAPPAAAAADAGTPSQEPAVLPGRLPRPDARPAQRAAPAPARADPLPDQLPEPLPDALPDPQPEAAAAAPAAATLAPSAEASLAALRDRLAGCTRCKLSQGRTQVVFGEGNPRARVMFVGEAPGFHEDQQGRPFVGAAGQLLDRIITGAMGLRRDDTYIANVNKCRPPDNREPEPDEVAACLPFLREQVRAIRPEVIVCLGRVASSNVLGSSLPMRALRGRSLSYEGIPVVVTWHPAYLLRNPAAKRETWDDIKRVNRLLGLPEQPSRPGNAAGEDLGPA